MVENNYYLTDGIFCSFNCCLAFIKSNWYNNLYSESEVLLNQIYYSLFDKNMKIMKAPSWRLLQVYGGSQTITEFRQDFNKVKYKSMDEYISEFPTCKSIGFLYEKKIKF